MKNRGLPVALFGIALVLAACASAVTVTESPTEGSAVEVPVTEEGIVQASENPEFGIVLRDGNRMSLYTFMKDIQNGGASSCTGECAEKWPPLLTQAVPVAGEGVDATRLGTITRDDGSLQVTYNGWPLYLYKTDVMAGDYYGQGLDDFGGLWFLMSPDGEAIQQ